MTVQIDLPADVVEHLTKHANGVGTTIDQLILRTIKQYYELPSRVDDAEQARRRQEAGRRIRELRKDNILGPDLTIRDLIDEGRRF